MTVTIRGLNLEKLLREAQQSGVALACVRRVGEREAEAKVPLKDRKKLRLLCETYGWEMEEKRAGAVLCAARFFRRRKMLVPGLALGIFLLFLSSGLVLRINIEGAKEYAAEVKRLLAQEGVYAGAMKRRISFDHLREEILLRLPGVSYAGIRYDGSVLGIECRLAREGENVLKQGSGLDLVAAQSGIVTRIAASSGTPMVRAGDAVRAGQVLVRGEERSEKGTSVPVRAQAQVFARVWAQGEARTSLYESRVQETGNTRTRVSIHTPWFSRVLCDCEPFSSQESEVISRMVIDLFIPLEKRTEILRETVVTRRRKDSADAASTAQGAAEKLAKKQLPAGALILDKWVDYSMIDNEFLYASVVLEYERDIAVRTGAP